MNGGKSNVIVYWTTEEEVLASNRSNYVIHRFEMKQTDDSKTFICTSNLTKDSYNVAVQLDLISK